MNAHEVLPEGQRQARTRWDTHTSGAAFDQKKTPYLTQQAQSFLMRQAYCVIAGMGPRKDLRGLLVMEKPGFVQILDQHTCRLHLGYRIGNSSLVLGLRQSYYLGGINQLGLFFISHATRERLCVQGTAELLPGNMTNRYRSALTCTGDLVRLHVRRAFFHCSKYIRTRIPGLTAPVSLPSQQTWRPCDLLVGPQASLSEAMRAFIAQQMLCFLCTVGQDGQCAINHRGGAPGFLLSVPPDATVPGGIVYLPDYAGNGAFEAIGNIFETGQAALVIPNYAAQLALCISGPARVMELDELPADLMGRCAGAERVVALSVEQVEVQSGDWSETLAYERMYAESIMVSDDAMVACSR
jgi:uncharacterized protein